MYLNLFAIYLIKKSDTLKKVDHTVESNTGKQQHLG